MRLRIALAGAAVFLLLAISGCAPPVTITSHSSAQLNTIGNVRLTTSFCTVAPDTGGACGPVSGSNNSNMQVKIGYTVPTSAGAPATFNSTSGRALTFSQDSTYTAAQAGVTVPEGRKWVGYSSNSFIYAGTATENITVAPQLSLTQGPGGAPFSGGFPHSVTVQSWDQDGFTAASTRSATQATRDLGVMPGTASVPAGRATAVPFNLKYAGASGSGQFSVAASSNAPGATAVPSISTLNPAADSDNPMTVAVSVPRTVTPGSYQVTVTANLAGQTRTGTAQLNVTAPIRQVRQVAAGWRHSCAILHTGKVRCWGSSDSGQLGQGNESSIGQTPATLPDSVPPVDLGTGRTALQLSAGIEHTCALLDNHEVLCWGSGAGGALGQGSFSNIGDNETPGSAGPVDLGGGHTATAVAAGGSYSCAILDDASVKCWGAGTAGKLGYGSTTNVPDPAAVGPVNLGAGRTATAIDAAADHTCVILSSGQVMCWGGNFVGKLGYGFDHNVNQNVGDDETPNTVGTINLGAHTALQVTGGDNNTCAILDDRTVRCWGTGFRGINGYPGQNDFSSPPAAPVDLGAGRTALSIEGGADHTCAVLDDRSLRCWGFATNGQLGYGNTNDIGDNETPGSAGPVNLGPGRRADTVNAGGFHTCAVMDTGDVRCWGSGQFLGYGNTTSIGDNETPDTAGPVSLND